jgi:hypothetical protein
MPAKHFLGALAMSIRKERRAFIVRNRLPKRHPDQINFNSITSNPGKTVEIAANQTEFPPVGHATWKRAGAIPSSGTIGERSING